MSGRAWNHSELRSKHVGQRRAPFHTRFVVELDLAGIGEVKWSVSYPLLYARIGSELVEINGKKELELKSGKLTIFWGDEPLVTDLTLLRFAGSVLAVLDEKRLTPALLRLRSAMKGLRSLELLSPSSMRRSSQPSGKIGLSGESLAGFFATAKPALRNTIVERVREFFPGLVNLRSVSKEFGWRFLVAHERDISPVTAKHLSDGFLRILAIVSQVEEHEDRDAVILIDEIENGLHPELISRLVKYLLQVKPQVIVTTHSPLILNYLSDQEARDSTILIYRNHEGKARSERYFELPSASKLLGILGPGEVYVDTPIDEVSSEADAVDSKSALPALGAAR